MEPFSLHNTPEKPKPWRPDRTPVQRQQPLFAGLDCLPDQMDLFATDGEPAKEDHATFGPVISSYTRAQAIEDGVLVDGMQPELAEVSRQHYKHPVAMTAAVFGLIQRAVENEKYCNDYKGVWHDVLGMRRMAAVQRWETGCLFRLIITGTGRRRNHTLKIECGPGDNGEPVMTVMMPDED